MWSCCPRGPWASSGSWTLRLLLQNPASVPLRTVQWPPHCPAHLVQDTRGQGSWGRAPSSCPPPNPASAPRGLGQFLSAQQDGAKPAPSNQALISPAPASEAPGGTGAAASLGPAAVGEGPAVSIWLGLAPCGQGDSSRPTARIWFVPPHPTPLLEQSS